MATNKLRGGARPARLAADSPYENLFGVRHRGRGRPDGSVEPVFVPPSGSGTVDPVIVSVAKRRVYAIVHEEQRERMSELFKAELKVLRRRGAEVVARDAGVALKLAEGSAESEEG